MKCTYQIKKEKESCFHINMLKKWHPLETTCFWMACEDDADSNDEEDAVLIGTQLSEKDQLLELLEEFKSVMSSKCEKTSGHTIYLTCTGM